MSECTTLSFLNKSKFDLYLEETIFLDESGFNLLFWWRSYGTKFPILSKMARDILAVLVSSVASESAFSTGGRVFDDKRMSLLPGIVEVLVCGKDWLVGIHKLRLLFFNYYWYIYNIFPIIIARYPFEIIDKSLKFLIFFMIHG
ncbi:hypothetical protein QJS04_geneDACA011909 [Acorus gramineus]|uniref:HAT C-terminal dimerisation domain-containing protein n=1 Tax=Acorus gramineus TaxID=55184 RepID=A0AAV9AHL1_ACOGR|nr:hypothetical protein QJS04_geneDACA011909 [Acorus gramineus]